MTQPMKELLLREFARGISAVAKRRNIPIDPMDLQCFLYKNISKCKCYGRSSVKFHIGYDGLILYNFKEIAKTPEEANNLQNIMYCVTLNTSRTGRGINNPSLLWSFRNANHMLDIRAFYGVHSLSDTLCTMYTNLEGTKRSLFNIFIR